jgi:hypothetical protein
LQAEKTGLGRRGYKKLFWRNILIDYGTFQEPAEIFADALWFISSQLQDNVGVRLAGFKK